VVFTTEKVTWITKGRNTYPVKLVVDNAVEKPNQLHESLAKYHRDVEKKVNYDEAKIKNFISKRNSEIHLQNAEIEVENRKETKP
jgi:hypothetical protein